jgi:regulation of enolase protein 1 (concanavalin A-like superfamily)
MDESAADRRALLHAARQLPRELVFISSLLARSRYSARRALNWERCGSTISSGNNTLSTVLRHGSSDGAWNAMPLILSGPVTGWPSMWMWPRLGIFKPVVSFMNVDLPHPDGPTMAMNSPFPTCSEMSSTANCCFASNSSL